MGVEPSKQGDQGSPESAALPRSETAGRGGMPSFESKSPDRFFDEFAVGDRFVTGRTTVTETTLVLFSGLSGDHNALHTDEVFAREGPFGQRIAQGCLTLSLASGLEYTLMINSHDKIIAFYGMDRVRFTAPVFIGDTIYLEGTVTAVEPRDDGKGVVTFHHEIKNQQGKTVASLEKRLLYRSRPAGYDLG
jgi:3-hydroxybutyryl-CoA dehydratase